MKSLKSLICEQLDSKIKIAFVGDIMQHDKQLETESTRNFSYTDVFFDFDSSFSAVIGNLETVISDDKNAGFPNFCATSDLLRALKKSGFTALTTANNHTFDQGDLAVEQTMTRIREAGMQGFGTCGTSKYVIKKNDATICIHTATDIINNMYNGSKNKLFETELINLYSKASMQPMSNAINIAIIHCGKEYDSKPQRRQLQIEKELQDNGFEIVLFIHSHVIGDDKMTDDHYTHYGLGNFLSWQESLDRQFGQVLVMTLDPYRFHTIEKIKTETIFKDGFQKVVLIN